MSMLDQALAWWRGGDVLMPVMFGVALVLYAMLAERSVVLWGVRRRERSDALLALLQDNHRGEGDARWRAWAAQYVALAEAEQLSRGFAVCRALTAALPLLGLLGTVTGMVDTFGQLGANASRGGVLAQHASAGIGLALTATQYGMALAIPAVAWDWLLSCRVAALAHHREVVVRQAYLSHQANQPQS
jgi:biopolymer transport protein ExbB